MKANWKPDSGVSTNDVDSRRFFTENIPNLVEGFKAMIRHLAGSSFFGSEFL
ncbi:hypothetical protein [Tumebacillus flagellatus]|uniref:hypothetical protein n=1 Tax=Tumebacillus flagellatus TaxID=1157490 RepID=UPI0013774C97|nr:hypothetical protein [Tumebacillus flagellatus]